MRQTGERNVDAIKGMWMEPIKANETPSLIGVRASRGRVLPIAHLSAGQMPNKTSGERPEGRYWSPDGADHAGSVNFTGFK